MSQQQSTHSLRGRTRTTGCDGAGPIGSLPSLLTPSHCTPCMELFGGHSLFSLLLYYYTRARFFVKHTHASSHEHCRVSEGSHQDHSHAMRHGASLAHGASPALRLRGGVHPAPSPARSCAASARRTLAQYRPVLSGGPPTAASPPHPIASAGAHPSPRGPPLCTRLNTAKSGPKRKAVAAYRSQYLRHVRSL